MLYLNSSSVATITKQRDNNMQHRYIKNDLKMLAEAYGNMYGPSQIDMGDGWKLEMDQVEEDDNTWTSYGLISPEGEYHVVQSSRSEDESVIFDRAKQMKEELMSA